MGQGDAGPVEAGAAHVDAEAAVGEAFSREVAGDGADDLVGAAVLLEQEVGDAAGGVAAGAGLGAVGVVDAHEQVGVGAGRGRFEGDELVAADAGAAVAEGGDARGGEAEGAAAVVEDDEVVAGAVHFHKGDQHGNGV